jgi:hypothetical protein
VYLGKRGTNWIHVLLDIVDGGAYGSVECLAPKYTSYDTKSVSINSVLYLSYYFHAVSTSMELFTLWYNSRCVLFVNYDSYEDSSGG